MYLAQFLGHCTHSICYNYYVIDLKSHHKPGSCRLETLYQFIDSFNTYFLMSQVAMLQFKKELVKVWKIQQGTRMPRILLLDLIF